MKIACPTCGSTINCPDDSAGKKANCPKCRQRLQIPGTGRSKTILATQVSASPFSNFETTANDEADESDESPIGVASPEKQAKKTPATIIVAASLLLGYGGLVTFCSVAEFADFTLSRNDPEPPPRRFDFDVPERPLQRNKPLAVLAAISSLAKVLISILILLTGVGVYFSVPFARWCAFIFLACDLLLLLGATVAYFVIVNMDPGPFARAISQFTLVMRFIPYLLWLTFSIPICALLGSPSAREAFSSRSLFGFR